MYRFIIFIILEKLGALVFQIYFLSLSFGDPFFLFLVVLEIELRALYMLGKHSTA
jgi:hypothetical protein